MLLIIMLPCKFPNRQILGNFEIYIQQIAQLPLKQLQTGELQTSSLLQMF